LYGIPEKGIALSVATAEGMARRAWNVPWFFTRKMPKEYGEAVLPLELKISSPEKVYSSVDYMTGCGVGLCGSCADDKGRRSCKEGPFMAVS